MKIAGFYYVGYVSIALLLSSMTVEGCDPKELERCINKCVRQEGCDKDDDKCIKKAERKCDRSCNRKCGKTDKPTKSPKTDKPTKSPKTDSPTASPTGSPTASPTVSPTASPTASPTLSPTASPTESPTASPTASPTESPTASPTASPTESPTASPTASPTMTPSVSPSESKKLQVLIVCGSTLKTHCRAPDIWVDAVAPARAIRCCSDTALPKFENYFASTTCPNVWARDWYIDYDYNSCRAANIVSYADAITICANEGGRLCTPSELKADCTRGAGCEFNRLRIWTTETRYV